jgi:hypothetical protein
VLEKNRPLGDILVNQGARSSPRHQLLLALVNEHVAQHGHDVEKSLAVLTPIGSIADSLRQIADVEIEASLAHVSRDRALL